MGHELQGIKELRSEAEKMASASASPYVIRLFGIMEGKSQELGIVMEYMEYGSLCTLMERVRPIPWTLKFRIIHEVTLGMNWLHNLTPPLLHLDLKTKNVLLNEGLHIKISDFGLSKFTSSASTQGTEDCEGVGGTLEYMPPEAFQEGYQPSTSTDVYSFAILSAVVLRGESPYPVDKSVLIRQLVPKGQRPCLKSLENETSVKDLSEAIEFTKCCWNNDKLKRPPFSECCNIWEKIFTAYSKCDIKQAVRKVQDEIDTSAPSGKTTDASQSGQNVSVNTKDMSEFFHKLTTLNITEESPALLESVPTSIQNTTTSVRPQALPQVPPTSAMVSNSRPQLTNYASHYGPVHVMSSPRTPSQRPIVHPETLHYLPGTMGPNYRFLPPTPQFFQGDPQFWYQPFHRYPTPPPFSNIQQPSKSNSTTINISGSSNFQIGDNSIMNVTDFPHPGSYRNIHRQPVYREGSRYSVPISTQPNQTTPGYHNMPERKASYHQPSQEETVKNNPKPHIPPGQTTSVGHSTNACNVQVTEGSGCLAEEPTTRPHPGP
ncbi:uncharacterized protein LOC143817098 isoform X2 [Ranitomeya variabilis]|uniref:uncharacterized protein LOC143817098 isoform X2 n=1 Tax=Ranitomeya variabilis TaxID=490064 RepID=UPI0040569ECD